MGVSAQANLMMLDSISVPEIELALSSVHPDALAGYTSGNWPTFPQVQAIAARLGIRAVPIAVTASEDAEFLDVEFGDATIAQVYAWQVRQRARKVWRPGVYVQASNAAALLATMHANGFTRSSWRLWSAHYTRTAHICGPGTCGYPQADGTQWTDSYLGRNLDASALSPSFFPAPTPVPPPPSPPPITEDPDMPSLLPGTHQVTTVVPPPGAFFKTIAFASDWSLAGRSDPVLRVAAHSVAKGWDIQSVTVPKNGRHVVTFAAPDVDEVSVQRVAGNAADSVNVGYATA